MKKITLMITLLTVLLSMLNSCQKENTTPSRGDVMFYKTSSSLGTIALQTTWRGYTVYDTLNYYFTNGRSTCLPFTDQTGSLNYQGFYYVDSIIGPETFSYSAHTLNNSRTWNASFTISNKDGSFICHPVVLD